MMRPLPRWSWAVGPLAVCLLALAVVGPGCRSGQSRESLSVPQTSDVRALISVGSSVPNEVSVSAELEQFLNGRTDPIVLTGGETFVATVDGVRQTLVNVATPDFPRYSTRFVGVSSSGDVEIVFYRAGNNDTRSRVSLGPDFDVTSPAPAEALAWTDDLILRWTPGRPGGRVMRIWVDVRCTRLPGTGSTSARAFSLQVADDGELVYDLDNLSMASSPDIDRSIDCTLDLDFRRESATSITPPYDSGSSLSAVTLRKVEGMTISF